MILSKVLPQRRISSELPVLSLLTFPQTVGPETALHMDNRPSGSALGPPDVPNPSSEWDGQLGLHNDFPGDLAYAPVEYIPSSGKYIPSSGKHIPSSGKEAPMYVTLSELHSVNYDFRKLDSSVFSSSNCIFWTLQKKKLVRKMN